MKQYPIEVIAKIAEANNLQITIRGDGLIIANQVEQEKLYRLLEKYEEECKP